MSVRLPPPAHVPSPAEAGDRLALLVAGIVSTLVLWFGTAGAQQLAVHGITGVPRTHATANGFAPDRAITDYGAAFDYTVAPLRADAAASIRSIRIEMRDLLPLPWGKGWL